VSRRACPRILGPAHRLDDGLGCAEPISTHALIIMVSPLKQVLNPQIILGNLPGDVKSKKPCILGKDSFIGLLGKNRGIFICGGGCARQRLQRAPDSAPLILCCGKGRRNGSSPLHGGRYPPARPYRSCPASPHEVDHLRSWQERQTTMPSL